MGAQMAVSDISFYTPSVEGSTKEAQVLKHFQRLGLKGAGVWVFYDRLNNGNAEKAALQLAESENNSQLSNQIKEQVAAITTPPAWQIGLLG